MQFDRYHELLELLDQHDTLYPTLLAVLRRFVPIFDQDLDECVHHLHLPVF